MKKNLLSIICVLFVVSGVFLFLLVEEFHYRKDIDSSYEEEIDVLDKEILKKKDELESLKNSNPRMSELELWERQVEKAKNY